MLSISLLTKLKKYRDNFKHDTKMKKNIFMILFFCATISCKKNTAELCDNGTNCCGVESKDWILVAKFENEMADYGRNALLFKNGFAPEGRLPIIYQHSVSVCTFSNSKVQGMEETYLANNSMGPPYKYRVWGRIFWARDAPSGITGTPALLAQIDKIEKIP
jgi:hypothetical protein